MKNAGKHAPKVAVGQWHWRGGVERARNIFIVNRKCDRGDQIIQRDPAHALAAACNWTARAQQKWREQFRKHAALRADDNANAHVHNANARVACGLRCRLPFLANLRQKSLAKRGSFIKLFVIARAVKANPAGAD